MLESILSFINFGVLLFFGIYSSAVFLGIRLNKENNAVLILFGTASLWIQMFSLTYLGMRLTEMLYPFITHLPLLLLFTFVFKRKPIPAIFAITSAYLFCQISQWIALLAMSYSHQNWIMYAVRILATIPIWYGIVRHASKSIAIILTKSTKDLLMLGMLPTAYYLFDYVATVYTSLLYDGSHIVFEFLPFMLCVAYLLFNVIYLRAYEEKCAAEQLEKLMSIQTAQSIKEIEELKRSKYEISLIRHDMRHFLSNISVMIENKDYVKAQEYIKGITQVTDQTVVQRYCENNLVNMVLSSYKKRMDDKNILFDTSVAIPAEFRCPELELTTILSNGLENAINAVSKTVNESRTIYLKLQMKNDKLLLSINNAYAVPPVFVNGLPVTEVIGHGLGTQSIQYMTAKLNGTCQFAAEDGIFSLRVVL